MKTYWLESYDLDPPIARRRLTTLSTARCGERTDWLWVAVEPPLELEPAGWPPGRGGLPERLVIDVAAIASRHHGDSIETGPWPAHVYVCQARTPDVRLADEFAPADVAIELWGTITPADDDP